MKQITLLILSLLMLFTQTSSAQNDAGKGYFSGDLMLNANFYQRDSIIGAAGNPFYDNLLTGGESWFTVNYTKPDADLSAGIRFDAFLNSNIFNPVEPVNGMGIGYWYIKKKIGKLDLQAGYFYDQFGTGVIFRAYELRPLGIDQAIKGVKAGYELTDKIYVKAFMGKLKNRFETYDPMIMGGSIEGNYKLGEKLFLSPGAAIINRTMDQSSMDNIVATIEAYDDLADRFIPKYNVYAYSFYNSLSFKNINWFVEYSAKTRDVLVDLQGKLIDTDGHTAYTSLSYSQKGFGITFQGKITDNFTFRTSPNETFLRGMINYLPSLSKQNSFRLPARYAAVTQELDEIAWQADVVFTPKKGLSISANVSDIKTSDGEKLFREYYLDVDFKKKKAPWHAIVGVDWQDYNQLVYQQEGHFVHTLTPFVEFDYKFTRKKSLRLEAMYMITERDRKVFGKDDPEERQDLGDWIFGLLEYNIAPKFSFSVTDMYNPDDNEHYYSALVAYTKRANRMTLSYVKQVSGVVCTGGVCRFEPAFSGARFSLTSSF